MISGEIIQSQIDKTREVERTALFLQHLVIQIVDETARAHYAEDYSMKCLQTSAAVQHLLKKIGIKSTLIAGAACFAKVGLDGKLTGWTGFWGDDPHVWLQTEFHEIVDLSISELHQHPRTRTPELPLPAIWWDQREGCPPLFCYLLDEAFHDVLLAAAEQEKYEMFIKAVDKRYDETLATAALDDIGFPSLLTCLHQLNQWAEEGRAWPVGALAIMDDGIPFPPWITDRKAEVDEALAKGEWPKSRLQNQVANLHNAGVKPRIG